MRSICEHGGASVRLDGCRLCINRTIEDIEIAQAIAELCKPEGACVTVMCPNPDGPEAIEICDDWTQYLPRRFQGDTRLECLQKALLAREVKTRKDNK